jgi:hypothetical protein
VVVPPTNHQNHLDIEQFDESLRRKGCEQAFLRFGASNFFLRAALTSCLPAEVTKRHGK